MKAIYLALLSAALLISGCSSEEDKMRGHFLSDCVRGGGTKQICNCAWDKIRSNYNIEDLLKMSHTGASREFMEEFMEYSFRAGLECALPGSAASTPHIQSRETKQLISELTEYLNQPVHVNPGKPETARLTSDSSRNYPSHVDTDTNYSNNIAPSVSYQAIISNGNTAGPFEVVSGDMTNALTYPSRAGIVNILENIIEYPDGSGYVSIEKAYTFGPHKYILVVSTGEHGRSCPASTYAISFDTQTEVASGSSIDGCSELVETFSDGNKLSIKKEGKTTTIYNGSIN